MFEEKAGVDQVPRDYPAALEHQFRLRPKRQRADLQQPAGDGKTETQAPRFAQRTHELRVRQRIRCSEVHGAGQILPGDEKSNRRDEVAIMNPGHKLPSVPHPPAQPTAHESEQRVERPAAVRTHDHRRTQGHLARQRSLRFVERALPRAGDVDAEAP